jgi:hypothetical protein
LHFGQIGDAAATNGARGPPSTLSFIRRHLFETIDSADPQASWILIELRYRVTVSRLDASGERRSQMPVPLTFDLASSFRN